MIPYGRQDVTQADIDAVVAVLGSDFLTQGPYVPEFESAVASKVRAKHAVAVNSATSALHIACITLGVGPGDWIWTSPISFVASANCGLYCGAMIDFVDIDPETYNICPCALEEKLLRAATLGRVPTVVVVVHMAGHPCDMAAIKRLSDQFGFKIIEDASHGIGARYDGEYIGNCAYSDIAIFSFHPVKIITTAEGGMALTNDPAIANRLQRLRSHGITRDVAQMEKSPDGSWYYEQLDLGFNYRMNDLQAALGLSQLKRLDHYVDVRRQLASRYTERLVGLPVKLPLEAESCRSSFHLYIVRIDSQRASVSHAKVFEFLRSSGVGVNLHYIPIHLQPYYQRLGFRNGMFPKAETYYSEALSLPIYPNLSHREQDHVISALEASLSE